MNFRNGVATIPMMLALSGLTAANAQDADTSSSFAYEEITITATKRPTTLQETPVAVSVTSEETIQKARVLDIKDLSSIVPSLRINQLQTSSNTNFIIRGFGNGANNAGIEPSVGVFIDGVYRSRSAARIGDLPKLQRIEVLRGPQSTLFGKNASAGVVSVVSAKPSFDPEGYVEAGYGNYNNLTAKGYFTTGISDSVAFSIGGNVNKRDGYVESGLSDVSDFNNRDRWSVRGQLLAEPSDATSIRVIADMSKIDEICCGVTNYQNQLAAFAVAALGGQFNDENDPFELVAYQNFDGVNSVDDNGISLHIDHELDSYAITSITSYRNNDSFFDTDADYNSLELLDSVSSDTDISTITQELRVASTGAENTLDWMFGVYYFTEDVEQTTGLKYGADLRNYIDVLANGPATLAGFEGLYGHAPGTYFSSDVATVESFTQDNTAYSLFGNIDWHINEMITISGGFNYTKDKKTIDGSTVNNDTFSNIDFVNDPTLLGITLPQVLFGSTFTDLTELAATPENIAAIETAAPGTSAAIQAGVDAGIAELIPLQFQPQFLPFPNAVEDGKTNDSDFTWNIKAAWDVNDWLNTYVSVATGFKSSSWNLSRDSRPFLLDDLALALAGLLPANYWPGSEEGRDGAGLLPSAQYTENGRNFLTRFAGPEEAKVYEIGFKARYERGAVNIAVFNQIISGFQSNTFLGTGFALNNAGKQSTKGFELDMTYAPTDWMKLSFSGTFLDPIYDEFEGGVDGLNSLTGERPAGIPSRATSTSVEFNKDFDSGASAYFRMDWQHESRTQASETFTALVGSEEPYRTINTFNASLGIDMENGWALQLWGRNLFNDEYITTLFPGVAQEGVVNGYRNTPRTYGFNARFNF